MTALIASGSLTKALKVKGNEVVTPFIACGGIFEVVLCTVIDCLLFLYHKAQEPE
jgi:hypothetical protein